MKVLVIGDRIIDHYTFCSPQKLCPEAPALVLKPGLENSSEGGAALVGAQLEAFLGGKQVIGCYGSVSHKHRIFADRTLVCRIDRDSTHVALQNKYKKLIEGFLNRKCDAVVVGDYGKGAMSQELAVWLAHECFYEKIPLFVDAKADPVPYKNCFAIFPNQYEHNGIHKEDYKHIIRKLGSKGCMVDGQMVSTEEQYVYDVTGAGDIFLASFVFFFLWNGKNLIESAKFANKIAGISVKHLGTYVVSKGEAIGKSKF